MFNEFKKYINIENTRMIYDFIEELSNRLPDFMQKVNRDWKYNGYVGIGGLRQREEKINNLKKIISCTINECFLKVKKPYYQNPLHSFLVFYDKMFGDPVSESDTITEMVNYFNILRFLTEPIFKEKIEFESLPYIFEDLCVSITNMTDAVSCYIIYKKTGEDSQIIARSGYVLKNSTQDDTTGEIDMEDEFSALNIGALEFDNLIKELFTCNDWKNDIDGVVLLEKSGQIEKSKHYYLVIQLPIMKAIKDSSTSDSRNFYVVLELKSMNADTKDLNKKALRVLFLRHRLLETLKKYYSALLNFRYNCAYVQSIGNSDGQEGIKILHISDIHMDDDESWSKNGEKWKKLENKLQNYNEIDLLFVTGDIVNSSKDAASAQLKYKKVARLLFMMACDLWSYKINNDIKILPHDWKRRILITTGNHDYAAMNDIKVQTQSRKIQAGFPAAQSGGTMAKYTYFIEFLSYFLDAPTKELTRDDLNQIRDYSKLGIIIGVFNSCSKANALQNNKVSFNRASVESVIHNSDWGNKSKMHLIMAHHAIDCGFDYLMDRYGIVKYQKIFKDDFLPKLYKVFFAALQEFVKSTDEHVDYKPKECCTDFVQNFSLVDTKREAEEKEMRQFKESQFYNDMDMLNKIISGKEIINDYVEQFRSDISGLMRVLEQDRDEFNGVYGLILQGAQGCQVSMFAGHEHVSRIYEEFSSFVVGKLYTDMEINFNLVEVQKKFGCYNIKILNSRQRN